MFGDYFDNLWPICWPLDAKASPSSWLTLAVGAVSELSQTANEQSRLKGLYDRKPPQTAVSYLHHTPSTH